MEAITLSWVVGTLFLWLPVTPELFPSFQAPLSKISSDVNVLGVTHAPHLPETPFSFLSSVAVILDPCDHSIGWRFS